MDAKSNPKKLSPPYISWKTFINYLESMRQAIPPRIDKSMMTRLSGINQSLMMSTLLYLGLIDKDGILSTALTQLIENSAPEKRAEFKTTLNKVLQSSYYFLFDTTGAFDLATSSSGDLDKKFEAQGISGQTVGKCEAFFITAAKDAGIKLSPYILEVRRRGPKGGTASGKAKSSKEKKDYSENGTGARIPPENPIEFSRWYATFKSAFDLLPEFSTNPKPRWTSNEKQNFLNLVTAIITAYTDVNDKK